MWYSVLQQVGTSPEDGDSRSRWNVHTYLTLPGKSNFCTCLDENLTSHLACFGIFELFNNSALIAFVILLWDLRLPQWRCWRFKLSEMQCCVIGRAVPDVWRRYTSLKHWELLAWRHSITSQATWFCIIMVLKLWNRHDFVESSMQDMKPYCCL
jgi:hypothetical protein